MNAFETQPGEQSAGVLNLATHLPIEARLMKNLGFNCLGVRALWSRYQLKQWRKSWL
ncbi:hypothetical protein O9993_12930 [Vibrio lentus]|nr:hypothetical protein [Vibrio lentus]